MGSSPPVVTSVKVHLILSYRSLSPASTSSFFPLLPPPHPFLPSCLHQHLGKTHKKLRVLRTAGPVLSAVIATAAIYLTGNPWKVGASGS